MGIKNFRGHNAVVEGNPSSGDSQGGSPVHGACVKKGKTEEISNTPRGGAFSAGGGAVDGYDPIQATSLPLVESGANIAILQQKVKV
jgi:hypothetical protein